MLHIGLECSPEACSYIASAQRQFKEDQRYREMAAVLSLGEGLTNTVGEQIVERYPHRHFLIGVIEPDRLSGGDYVEVEVGDVKIWISLIGLDFLSGKKLTLDCVDVGWPSPASRKKMMLLAHPIVKPPG